MTHAPSATSGAGAAVSVSAAAAAEARHGIPLWMFVATLLLTAALWSGWNAYADYKAVIEAEYRVLEVRAQQREARISGALRNIELVLGNLIDDLNNTPRLSVTEQNHLLRNHLRQLPELRNMVIADAAGRIRAEAKETSIGADTRDREYFKHHRAAPGDDGYYLSRPFKTHSGVISAALTHVLRDKSGQFAGVVIASIDSKYFHDALQFSTPHPGVEALLINVDGDILAVEPPSGLIGKNLQGGIAFTEHMRSGQRTTRHLNQVKLEPLVKIAVFHNLAAAPLTVIVSRNYDDVLRGWRHSLYSHLAGFIVLTLTILLLARLLAQRQTSLVRAQQQVIEREARLRITLDSALDAVISINATGRLIDFNPMAETIFGWKKAEVIGRSMTDLLVPHQHREAHTKGLARFVLTHESHILNQHVEITALRRDGTEFPVELTITAMRQNEEDFFTAYLRDITERQKQQAALSIAAAAFDSQEGFVVTDAHHNILRINKSFTDITGYTAAEAIGQSMKILRSGQHDADFYAAMWVSITHDGMWKGEIWNRTKNGELHPHAVAISSVKNANGETTHYVGSYTDVTERKRIEEEVRQLAFHDTLTGLPNRRLFGDRIHQAMALCKRNHDFAALIFLDLDNFKPLNDLHGHEFGDLLLIQVAERMKSCVREMDTVGRFGGDEFVVLICELGADRKVAVDTAAAIAEKIRTTIALSYALKIEHGQGDNIFVEHHCTASIGITLFTGQEASADDIFKQADTAMYAAKESGRNATHFFEPGE